MQRYVSFPLYGEEREKTWPSMRHETPRRVLHAIVVYGG